MNFSLIIGTTGSHVAHESLNQVHAASIPDSLPPGTGLRLCFPSLIEEWGQDSVSLITDVFSQKGAVQVIQDKYFDGHPILFRDVEAKLNETLLVPRFVGRSGVSLTDRGSIGTTETF